MKYVIDIDGTIFNSVLHDDGSYEIVSDNSDMIDKINISFQDGHEIILHTGRHWNHLQKTKEQLRKYGVDYTTLVMGKPVGDFYIDDKAIKPDEWTI